ncbi:hypothetical protein Q3G72_004438 [Acer saccharum]|nr:hypothetical protein Q3G72_004438 [Acer saccharum]
MTVVRKLAGEIAREATEKLEAHAIQLGPNSGSNSIESDDSISVAYAKLIKKKDNNEVEKLDAGMEVYAHGDDEVKKSKGHGEAVEEVNDQTVNPD